MGNGRGGDGCSEYWFGASTVPYQDWYYNPTFEAVRPPLCCLAERILGTRGMHVLCMYLYFQVKPKGCFIGFKQCFPDSGMHK